ncbi:GMC oxidoreductase [Amycolatopsis sacchari]|uniref:GMC oxidoreductase n=1 Tax=Amycolatopsis sacchari TaxID=115433 RepID=UPI003EC03864
MRVRGTQNLRIADASVLPRITSGNTMAPCVVVGYRAAALIHGRAPASLAADGDADAAGR